MVRELVSVMMPAYNAEKYIGQAIESVLAQSYANWELIIVNDGSIDKTQQIVEQYRDPRVKLINQVNGGEASARNTALQNMQGEYFAFLDSDDCYLPEHLDLTIKHLKQYPGIDGVYTDGYYINKQGKVIESLSHHRRGPFEGWLFEQLVRASDVFGPPICVVLRRDLIDQHNYLFDTRIIIGPDWDFTTHFAEHATFNYIDHHTCLYRVHDANITTQANRQKRMNSLALCREKAIKLPGFARCSPETRRYVFYDLLINLLSERPEKADEVTRWQEFLDLPPTERSRLFRLMASQAILEKTDPHKIRGWLQSSQRLNPRDFRGNVIWLFYLLSPALSFSILRLRRLRPSRRSDNSPFGTIA